MSLRINQNPTSIRAYSNLNQTGERLEKSIQKLSTGLRINSASDDAAGLAVSEKMRRTIRGLDRAALNAQDGISMLQTAEGALDETQSMVQRMRELAIASSNDTLTSNDRLEIQKEVNQLRTEVDKIAQNTEFNTKKLLDGSQTALISSSSTSAQGIVTGPGSKGGTYDVDMKVISGGISQMSRTQLLRDKDGNVASNNTKLEDVAQLYDDNDRFILDSPKQLTITGNTKEATVNVDAQMTLGDLSNAMQRALTSESAGLGIANSKSTFIDGSNNAGGYMQITSGAVGDSGGFSIAGSQDLIDALGFSNVRESKNSRAEVSVTDHFGNKTVTTTSSDRTPGLLNGYDIQFDSQSAQIAGHGGVVEGLDLDTAGVGSVAQEFKISVEYTSVASVITKDVSIGITGGTWSMEGLAKEINRQLGVAASGTTGGVAEAIKGLKASVVDNEIMISSSANDKKFKLAAGTAGADIIGIKAGTHTGESYSAKDMTKAIKGIERSDKATTLAVGDGIASAATNVVIGAQVATQQNMLEASEFVKTANATLSAADKKVRADIVDGSIAFTSTKMGQKNNDNGTASKSNVTLTITGDKKADFEKATGLSSGAAYGSGDTNFRLHIVAKLPKFQIGSAAGHNMEISIGDMTAKALDIDKIDLTSVEGAQKAIGKLDKALDTISGERSKLGAYQNRLEHSVSSIRSTSSNLTDAESRIRDVDVALEMIEFTRNQIASQAGTAMLAQANSIPQSALSLLG